jgi:hypothetical protein
MKEIKEAIEKSSYFNKSARTAFEEREKQLKSKRTWPNTRWYNDEDFCEIYKEALTLLRSIKEPPAGEFTKEARELADLTEEDAKSKELSFAGYTYCLTVKLHEACGIIDSQAEEKNIILNRIIDMNCAITGWKEKSAYNSEDDLIGELERMIEETLEKHKT